MSIIEIIISIFDVGWFTIKFTIAVAIIICAVVGVYRSIQKISSIWCWRKVRCSIGLILFAFLVAARFENTSMEDYFSRVAAIIMSMFLTFNIYNELRDYFSKK